MPHITMPKVKDKKRILKATGERNVTYKGILRRLTEDFSAEILQARREWHNVFKTIKGKNLHLRRLPWWLRL